MITYNNQLRQINKIYNLLKADVWIVIKNE